LASASADRTIKLWRLPDGELLNTLTGHADSVYSLAFSHDGSLLISASEDKTVRIWNMPDGTLNNSLKDPACEEKLLCDDNRYPATSCRCNTVSTCTCDKICTCDQVCSSDSSSSCGGTYWYPN
ncbi:MAG: hypothetical protein EHM72_15965, partial [Calditrichaeota bacterium]